jgi:hypothetical protein
MIGAIALAAGLPAPAQEPDDITFEGAWSATGERHTLPAEDGRTAAIVRLSGSVVFTSGGLGRGFRGEVIGYDDGRGTVVGRWVWTDEQGDRIFGDLKGEPLGPGRRLMGIITGGSGRYAGVTGEYEFTWQYVASGEGQTIQGRTAGLKGRYRRVRG